MLEPKAKELAEASRICAAKQELLGVLFKDGALDLDLISILPERICSICNDPTPAGIRRRRCGDCNRVKTADCDHFESAAQKIFAFDLCEPSKRVPVEEGNGRRPKRNMDIYSAQKLAAERARAFFDRIVSNECVTAVDRYLDEYTRIDDDLGLDFGDDYRENRLVQIVMVGASVTGLTFHATLAELMNNSEKCQDFDNLFSIAFVDLHKRPLERLMQARGRTVVPRFEYERLLSTPIKARTDGPPEPWFVDAPQFLPEDEARHYWQKSHPDMPMELRWSPGPARIVADQIATGHKAWMKRAGPTGATAGLHKFNPYVHITQYLSHWFLGVRPSAGEEHDRTEERDLRLFGVGLTSYSTGAINGEQEGEEIRSRPALYGDILFKATGLGIDISGDQADDLRLRQQNYCVCDGKTPPPSLGAIYDFPNVQRSYWDPIKPELDLPEEKSSQILVVGNSDAAAGAIFSTLLTEFNSCTFRVLAELLWSSDSDGSLTEVQKWFANLQEQVEALVKVDPAYNSMSITRQWINALKNPEVQYEMLDSQYGYQNELKPYLRGQRAVCVGLRWNDDDDALLNEFEAEYDEYQVTSKTNRHPNQRYLASKFMAEAWPENRLLAVLLRDRLSVLLLNYGVEEKAPFDITRKTDRLKKTYSLTGDVTQIEFVGERTDMKGIEIELKYVINCGGPPYFQHGGNALISTD